MEIVVPNMFTFHLMSNPIMKAEDNAASHSGFVTVHQRKYPCNVRAPLQQAAPGAASQPTVKEGIV